MNHAFTVLVVIGIVVAMVTASNTLFQLKREVREMRDQSNKHVTMQMLESHVLNLDRHAWSETRLRKEDEMQQENERFLQRLRIQHEQLLQQHVTLLQAQYRSVTANLATPSDVVAPTAALSSKPDGPPLSGQAQQPLQPQPYNHQHTPASISAYNPNNTTTNNNSLKPQEPQLTNAPFDTQTAYRPSQDDLLRSYYLANAKRS